MKRLPRRSLLLAIHIAATGLVGSCLDPGLFGDGGAERLACEELCALEAQCADVLGRTEEECLASLCDAYGFRVFEEAASPTEADEPSDAEGAADTAPDAPSGTVVDLEELGFIACAREAEDCQALALCACPDACARTDTCLGAPDPFCIDSCESLTAQDPGFYEENRCKMESSCAELPTCGAVSG